MTSHSRETSNIVACGQTAEVGSPVLLWKHPDGFACPHPRGRPGCHHHDPVLNDAPTRAFSRYRIQNPAGALEELRKSVHQLVIHYDVCFTSAHCHELLRDSDFKGSHFYLDLDGTLYQTCDLYWKTNTAPADDRKGNDRAVHVEMANLSWQARAEESNLYHLEQDAYQNKNGVWSLNLPRRWEKTLYYPESPLQPSRVFGNRGFFSRRINGRLVRMWDFTEAQYATLLRLCYALNELLPGIKLQVPFDRNKKRTPLNVLPGFSKFRGILGHAHVQSGRGSVKCKYDPGSAFDWGRLRRTFASNKDPRGL